MRRFSRLISALDRTTGTNAKVAALVDYLSEAPPADAVWAVRFLVGRRPKRAVPLRNLSEWASEAANIPQWLFEASYEAVGDLAETIALILPPASASSRIALKRWVTERLLPLRGMPSEVQKEAMAQYWKEMDRDQRFVWNKLITGGFRVGVSQRLVIRALSETADIPPSVVAHRLMGQWEPTEDFYHRLLSRDLEDAEASRPYPFCLAHPLDSSPEALGDLQQWQAEWKWDGIRAQVLRRQGQVFLWTRGEELVTERYPELEQCAARLPDGTAIDGEILAWRGDFPCSFGVLQRRIGRKTVGRKLLQEIPVVFMAYDLLEQDGRDVRSRPLFERRRSLQRILKDLRDSRIRPSPEVRAESWSDLQTRQSTSRSHGVEGLMLKRLASAYAVGRRRGDWWKWKVDPFTVDAVLVYARRGHGRRSGLYTDYTFAVWGPSGLVPFAKAYSGLSDAEIRNVDRYIRRNTVERYGPVRSVTPALVFEIAFEALWPSPRHKSGVAVRFPRIACWRTDKTADEADRLETLQALMAAPGQPRQKEEPGKGKKR